MTEKARKIKKGTRGEARELGAVTRRPSRILLVMHYIDFFTFANSEVETLKTC